MNKGACYQTQCSMPRIDPQGETELTPTSCPLTSSTNEQHNKNIVNVKTVLVVFYVYLAVYIYLCTKCV